MPDVVTFTPTDVAVGAGEPHGKAITSQAVSVLPFTHETVADVESTLLDVKAVGSGQVGKSSIITLSINNLHPSKPPCGICHAIFTGPV